LINDIFPEFLDDFVVYYLFICKVAGPEAQKAFQDLKTIFTTTPIFVHPDFSKPFYMETDALDFVIGAVLSQKGEGKRLHPVAFYSRKFSVVEINYEIHDKELLAIVDSFKNGPTCLKVLHIR
jgi:hypothetical protein